LSGDENVRFGWGGVVFVGRDIGHPGAGTAYVREMKTEQKDKEKANVKFGRLIARPPGGFPVFVL